MIKNGTMHSLNTSLPIEDKYCPICGSQYILSINIYTHPNDMFNITSCEHINVRACSTEEKAQLELDIVIQEILDFQKRDQ